MATAEEERLTKLAKAAAKTALQGPKDVIHVGNLDRYDTQTTKKRLQDNFLNKTSQDNPAFIWPGSVARTMNGTHKPMRGYIRRLNEFYQRMDDGGEPSNIQGRRCNFQIQPDGLTRSVGANSLDTQFFFNQDPAQLSVPIPGNSGYKLTLLFNREPEVSSGKYLGISKNGGQVLKGAEGLSDNFDPMTSFSDAEFLLTGEYSPEWVTKIGVLADIMVLDAVIGQGISKETLDIIQQISQAQKDKAAETTTSTDSTDSEDATKDEQDKTVDINATAADYWLQDAENNPNIGNTAFLVPTPIRIMLSNLMMVEGFVLSSDVNFFKFSKNYVPTQCRVDLQIQALYIGFAKTQTILTASPFLDKTTGLPDVKPKTQAEIDVTNATLDGIKSIYSKCDHHKGGKDLLNYILKSDPQQQFNFTLELNDKAIEYVNTVLWAEGGGNPVWTWDGKITINWESHITGASNTRQPTRTSATGGSYTAGFPSGFEYWGTKSNPVVLATGSGKIFVYEDVVYLGKTYRDQDHVIGNNDSDIFGTGSMEAALWDMYSPGTLSPRPFEQDKFRVQLEINIKLERGGTLFPVGQKVVFDKIVTCGEDVIFKGITLSNVPQT